MKIDTLIQAAKEYRALMKLNAQIKELSLKSLSIKFECSRRAVASAEDGIHVPEITEADYRLIRECMAERERLTRSKNGETRASIAKRYKIRSESLAYGLDYI